MNLIITIIIFSPYFSNSAGRYEAINIVQKACIVQYILYVCMYPQGTCLECNSLVVSKVFIYCNLDIQVDYRMII